MPTFKVSVGFRRPGATWQHAMSRDVSESIEAPHGVAAVLAALSKIKFDEREQLHFIHISDPDD